MASSKRSIDEVDRMSPNHGIWLPFRLAIKFDLYLEIQMRCERHLQHDESGNIDSIVSSFRNSYPKTVTKNKGMLILTYFDDEP